MKKLAKAILFPAASVIGVIAVWWIVAAAMQKPIILPTPGHTLAEFFSLLGGSKIYLATLSSLLRAVIAFAFSFCLAILLSALSLMSSTAKKLISPIVSIARALPTMAVILLFLVWTSSKTAPIFVTMLVIFPTLYSAIFSAICAVDPRITEMATLYGKSKRQVLWEVVLPISAPTIAENGSAALSLSIKLVIAAEVLSLTVGSLGELMASAQMYFNTGMLLALTLVAVIVSTMLELLVNTLCKRIFFKWRKGECK